MHQAVIDYVQQAVARYALKGDCLDLGGRDVNGSIHHLFPPDTAWTVVDQAPHPSVDVVADAATLELGRQFDVVVSTETLEHTPKGAEIVASAHRHLKPGGMFLATMAGPGRYPHGASGEPAPPPGEWYRNVTPDDLALWLAKAGFEGWSLDQNGLDLRVVAWKEGVREPALRDTLEVSAALVDVIVPVLHRPANVEPFMASLQEATEPVVDVWFVVEPDDDEEVAEVLHCGGRVLIHPGTFAEKVNWAYGGTKAPWLFLVGDDVRFRPGWLEYASKVQEQTGAQVIGTNDLGNPAVLTGNHATHMLVNREYIDKVGASWDGPGIVAHEGYHHWFIDNEIITAAKQRGVWAPSLASVVEHLHPYWGKAEDDEVYQRGRERIAEDQALWQRRLAEHTATVV